MITIGGEEEQSQCQRSDWPKFLCTGGSRAAPIRLLLGECNKIVSSMPLVAILLTSLSVVEGIRRTLPNGKRSSRGRQVDWEGRFC